MGTRRALRHTISDAFWAEVEPWVPAPQPRHREKQYLRAPGGGRKPLESRLIFEAIVHVLRTGCAWKDLPRRRFGSGSAIHKHFLYWASCGFFCTLWDEGLAEAPELHGIPWICTVISDTPATRPLHWQPAGVQRRGHFSAERTSRSPHGRSTRGRRASVRRAG